MPYTQEQEPKPKGPAPEGRIEVEAVVLGIKAIDNPYTGGKTWKMLVRLEETLTKAWVTIPSGERVERGQKIMFKASFERSTSDPFFAFGKRAVFIHDVAVNSKNVPSNEYTEEERF